jgi:hypothetical protein
VTSTRRLATIPIIGAALGLLAFGIVRGATDPGPARGTRLAVALDPPLDTDARKLGERVIRERIDERGMESRIVGTNDGFVVEVGEDDPEIVAGLAALLERRATLAVHAVEVDDAWLASVTAFAASDPRAREAGVRIQDGVLVADDRRDVLARYLLDLGARAPELRQPEAQVLAFGRAGERTWRAYVLAPAPLLDGRAITHAEIISGGVAIDVAEAAAVANIITGTTLAFVLEGIVRFVGAPDRVDARGLHVPTPGATTDEAIQVALELVVAIEAGAVHPMRVVRRDPFTRATGFWPRAAPFVAIAAVLLLVAAFVWRAPRSRAKA